MNEQLPLVSIITPSFNQAPYLEQTIQSVLEQDYPRLEYLVVDGGSTDGSLEIIRKYADRLAWWISEPDLGQADAINKGLRRATGEFVAWLNSDDLYLAGTVSRAVAAFQQFPQAGMVFGDVLSLDGEGELINIMRYGDWNLEDLMAFRIIGQPAVFMRRNALEEAGYLDPAYHFLLDHHLWLRMASLAEMHYVPERWAAARFHSQAKNIARGAELSREAYRLVDWMQTVPRLTRYYHENEKRIQAGAHRFHAHYLLDDGQAGRALQMYGRCARSHLPTALREWRRILFACLSLLGLFRLRAFYLRWRKRSMKKKSQLIPRG